MSPSAFADRELSELFDREPELLAIADAIAATSSRRSNEVADARRWPLRRRWRLFLAVTLVVAMVAAAPAFAFSPAMRRLVGLASSHPRPPVLQATITNVSTQHRLTIDLVTVKFVVGEPGGRPGSGIPKLSAFFVSVVPRGAEVNTQMSEAHGANGRYVATAFIPHGGIRAIEIGGWLGGNGSPTAAGGFFIPIVTVNHSL